jgi:hypothetical protein
MRIHFVLLMSVAQAILAGQQMMQARSLAARARAGMEPVQSVTRIVFCVATEEVDRRPRSSSCCCCSSSGSFRHLIWLRLWLRLLLRL